MPFTTEITNIKTEINAGLAASQYTAKDLVYVSKAIESLAAAETASGTFDTASIDSILYVGTGAAAFGSGLTNPKAVFVTNESDYAQIAFKNSGTSVNSSTDVILYTNNGTDSNGWIDMGITSSNFADPSFTITGKGDGYIFVSGAAGGDDRGNLVLATDATGSQNKIIFAAGGLDSNDTQMVITPDVNVHIEIPTPSTSPSTGALTVVGGVGIQGDVNIQGDITFGGTGTTLTTSTLAVSDPQVIVGDGNTTDAVDLGLVGEYTTGGTLKYTGVVRDASDGVYKFFKDTTVAPSTGTINFSGAGLAYSDIKVGGIDATSATIGDVSNTELQYLNGVTSAIQTQLNAKSPSDSPTFTGTVTLPSTTSIGNVSATEIGYLDSVTSSIQTQLDNKLSTSTAASTYLTQANAASTYAPLIQTTTIPTFSSNNYTLVAGDKDKIVLASNGSTAGNITVPNGIFSVGSVITIVQTGTGQLTLVAPAATLNSQGNKLKLNGQYASCQLICTASNTFLVIGNLAA